MDISHSSRKLFHSCERKFQIKKIYSGAGESLSYAGDVGNALHVGIQEYARTRDPILAYYGLLRNYPRKYQKSEKDARGIAACYATLKCMMDKYDAEGWELATVNGKPAIEVAFCIKIKNTDIRFVGKIDFIILDPMTGKFKVVDVKTTTLDPKFAYSDQDVPYSFVLEYLQSNEASSCRSRGNFNFAGKFIHVDYMVAKIDVMNPTGVIESFKRAEVDVNEWAFGLIMDIQQIDLMKKINMFRRNGDACTAWNRECEFYGVCYERDPEKLMKILPEGKQYTFPFDVEFELDLGI